jgi:hypothetical protein
MTIWAPRAQMVNCLLTISIKVNVLRICRIILGYRGLEMKKTKSTRGLWTWLLGGGWCGGGAGG